MKLELSTEQYKKLVELVYLGGWLANSFRTDDRIEDLAEVEHLIYSKAEDFQAEDLFLEKSNYGYVDVNQDLEKKLHNLIEEYDEDSFWAELAERLAKRDLLRKLGPVQKITEEQLDQLFELEEQFYREFEKNGLKNIVIQLK